MDLSRLESLIGTDNIERIKNLNVLIIGLGGVGGYALESLARCGIEHLTLVDGDTIKPSNINRQIIATSKNNDKLKTEEWKNRINLINPNSKVKCISEMINEDNIDLLFSENYDYIIDCCDTTKVKVLLIRLCDQKGIKLVSSMGMAKKMDATKIKITTLNKTDTDPLARKIRSEIRDKDLMRKVTVVYSTEPSIDNKTLGSNSFVPSVAGLFITNYIINNENKKA